MRQFSASYDPRGKKFVFLYKNRLMKKYQEEFDSSVKDLENIIEIEKCPHDLGICSFSVPLDVEEEFINHKLDEEGEKTGFISLALPPEKVEKLSEYSENIQKKIIEFEKEVVDEETKGIEFIPLEGYPIEELQKDIQSAIQNKRDFCVIDTMSSYMNFMKTMTLNQAYYKYGTDMYYNIFIAIHNGDMEELKSLTKNSLRKKEWA